MNGGRVDNLLLAVKRSFAVEVAKAQHDHDGQFFFLMLLNTCPPAVVPAPGLHTTRATPFGVPYGPIAGLVNMRLKQGNFRQVRPSLNEGPGRILQEREQQRGVLGMWACYLSITCLRGREERQLSLARHAQ